MWWFPWEKLHPAVLGPLLILAGTIALFDGPLHWWHELEAGLSVVVGIGLFIHGVKELVVESREPTDKRYRIEAEKRLTDEAAPPNYEKYTEAQLRQVLNRVDKERFPDRVAEIEARLTAIAATREARRADERSVIRRM